MPVSVAPSPTSFTIGPLAWVTPVDDFRAWLRRAAVGEVFTYAQGVAAPRGELVWKMAGELHAAGMVTLTTRREGRTSFWQAQRRAVSVGAVSAGLEAAGAGGETLSRGQRDLLDMLALLAATAQPCPTNREVSEQLGLRRPASASYLFAQLAARGLISIDYPSDGTRRVVTIPRDGTRTAEGVY